MKRSLIRKWLYGLAAVAALAISGPMLPVELAVWFSAELMLYLEVVGGVWLASTVAGVRAKALWIRSRLAFAPARLVASWSRSHPRSISWVQNALAFQ